MSVGGNDRIPRLNTTPYGRPLAFTQLGFGGAPLGNLGRILAEDEADAVVDAAWAAGLRYFDTAPLYGHGLSEARLGRQLRGRPRSAFVISTKVGRLLEPCAPGDTGSGIYLETPPFRVRFDYSGDGVRRSLEASLERLGLDRVDIVYVHDVEPRTHGGAAAYEVRMRELLDGGGWRALSDLRDSGAVQAIGLGVNEIEPCERLLRHANPDLFLLAGRYTLLEQGAAENLLPTCEARGVGVVIGGPFNSGVLVRDGGSYDYARAPAAVVERVKQLSALCRRHQTPLPAAALQFAAAHPAVVSVIPGGQTAAEVAQNAQWMTHQTPAELWPALRDAGLISERAPTPRGAMPAC